MSLLEECSVGVCFVLVSSRAVYSLVGCCVDVCIVGVCAVSVSFRAADRVRGCFVGLCNVVVCVVSVSSSVGGFCVEGVGVGVCCISFIQRCR